MSINEGLPVIDPAELGPPVRNGPVVGVLLAAGESVRYGEPNKLLVDVDGEQMVYRSARTLTDSDVDAVVVVVGHEAGRVRAAIEDLPVEVVENPDYAAGQASSVRVGIRAARDAGAAAVCFALGDMPWVRPGTVDALVRAYRAGVGDPLAAAVAGQRGNPTLFGSRHFAALEDVSGDVGGRELLLTEDDAVLVETGDPAVTRDVDVPEDLSAGTGS